MKCNCPAEEDITEIKPLIKTRSADFPDVILPMKSASPTPNEPRVARAGRAKKPPTKRRSRAVLTKEQAIEVFEQKLANEAPSAAADARAAANAAVVARR